MLYYQNNNEMIKLLLEKGVVPRDPLTFAEMAGTEEIRDLLKRYGY